MLHRLITLWQMKSSLVYDRTYEPLLSMLRRVLYNTLAMGLAGRMATEKALIRKNISDWFGLTL